MLKNRIQKCRLVAREIELIFPSGQPPLNDCPSCHFLRFGDGQFFCGLAERLRKKARGEYINRPALTSREVRLARGVIVDGNSIPKGTVLYVVGDRVSSRVWCRRFAGRGTAPPFQVKRDDLDLGSVPIVVSFSALVIRRLERIIQIGPMWLPVDAVELLVEGKWLKSSLAVAGIEISSLRLPLWLAHEKGLETNRK